MLTSLDYICSHVVEFTVSILTSYNGYKLELLLASTPFVSLSLAPYLAFALFMFSNCLFFLSQCLLLF